MLHLLPWNKTYTKKINKTKKIIQNKMPYTNLHTTKWKKCNEPILTYSLLKLNANLSYAYACATITLTGAPYLTLKNVVARGLSI